MDVSDLDRFLVTGAGGMVGAAIPFGLKYSRQDLDITDVEAVAQMCSSAQPTGILHLAALDIRQSHNDPLAAYAINVLGTYNMAHAARTWGIPFVFISSGAVFSGLQTESFNERSVPSPLNIYGQTKYVAELLVENMMDRSLIVRTGWLFGGHSAHHRKFVDVTIHRAIRSEPVLLNDGQFGSPTYIEDFVGALKSLMLADAQGIVHIVNTGRALASDVAREIIDELSSSSRLEISPVGEAAGVGPQRSPSEVLTSLSVQLRPWQEAVRDHVIAAREASD